MSETAEQKAAAKQQEKDAKNEASVNEQVSDAVAANQNQVLKGSDKEDAVKAAAAAVVGGPVQTVITVGDREKGPRTYAEAVQDAQTAPKDQDFVVDPSNYEAAVAAVDPDAVTTTNLDGDFINQNDDPAKRTDKK